MITTKDVFRIGVLGKPHGIRGEVSFIFDNDIFDRVDCPYLVLKVDGIFVPFFIEEYRFKGKEIALITFQDIDSEEKVIKLQGVEVFFPRKFYENNLNEQDLNLSWDFFIGFTAIDNQSGILGTITAIDTQTINTLFIIASDDNDTEILVPAVEDFIVEIDTKNRKIYLNLPEGIIDLE